MKRVNIQAAFQSVSNGGAMGYSGHDMVAETATGNSGPIDSGANLYTYPTINGGCPSLTLADVTGPSTGVPEVPWVPAAAITGVAVAIAARYRRQQRAAAAR